MAFTQAVALEWHPKAARLAFHVALSSLAGGLLRVLSYTTSPRRGSSALVRSSRIHVKNARMTSYRTTLTVSMRNIWMAKTPSPLPAVMV